MLAVVSTGTTTVASVGCRAGDSQGLCQPSSDLQWTMRQALRGSISFASANEDPRIVSLQSGDCSLFREGP